MFLVLVSVLTFKIFIVNSSTLFPVNTVKILASPRTISELFATSIKFLSLKVPVYVPNMPLVVFSSIVPYTVFLLNTAFFSPVLFLSLLIAPVTSDLNILPFLTSIFWLVLASMISWVIC